MHTLYARIIPHATTLLIPSQMATFDYCRHKTKHSRKVLPPQRVLFRISSLTASTSSQLTSHYPTANASLTPSTQKYTKTLLFTLKQTIHQFTRLRKIYAHIIHMDHLPHSLSELAPAFLMRPTPKTLYADCQCRLRRTREPFATHTKYILRALAFKFASSKTRI